MRSHLAALGLVSVLSVVACSASDGTDARPLKGGASSDSSGKSSETSPTETASPTPPDNSPSGSSSPQPDASAGASSACTIDGITWRGAGYQVIAKGRVWSLDGNGALVGTAEGTDLRALAGMNSGPCATQGTICHVDTFAWIAERSEYWVAYGTKTWILDAQGALKGAIGNDANEGMKAGPCAGQAVDECMVQAYASGNGSFFVVSNATLWRFDANLNLVPPINGMPFSWSLQTMCGAIGGNCTIDDFTWRDDLGQFQIIAGGRTWFADVNGNLLTNSGVDLKTFSGFAQGPCAP